MMSKKDYVVIGREKGRGVDSAWIDDEGQLVVQWYEWVSDGDEDNGVPYNHADTITFDADARERLAKALDLPEGNRDGDRLLAEIQKRFDSYFAVREFAEENGIPFSKEVDFMP